MIAKLFCFGLLVACVSAQFECFAAPATAEDRRPDKSRLRVVSFNVEWLFDGTDSRDPWNTPEEAQKHVEAIAAVIKRLSPDIVAMQEVQNCPILNDLINALQDQSYKPYLVRGTDTGTGQNVAIISRVDPSQDVWRTSDRFDFPLPGSSCGDDSTGSSGVSKHQFFDFSVNGEKYHIVNAHLIAFPDHKQRCLQREAQASVLRSIYGDWLANGERVIMLGDMNDYSDLVPDVVDNKPISRVIRIFREGLVDETGVPHMWAPPVNGTQAGRADMEEACAVIPQSRRYTSAYGNNLVSQIDHVLLSSNLRSRMQGAFIDHSYGWQEVSDHWPVVVDLRT